MYNIYRDILQRGQRKLQRLWTRGVYMQLVHYFNGQRRLNYILLGIILNLVSEIKIKTDRNVHFGLLCLNYNTNTKVHVESPILLAIYWPRPRQEIAPFNAHFFVAGYSFILCKLAMCFKVLNSPRVFSLRLLGLDQIKHKKGSCDALIGKKKKNKQLMSLCFVDSSWDLIGCWSQCRSMIGCCSWCFLGLGPDWYLEVLSYLSGVWNVRLLTGPSPSAHRSCTSNLYKLPGRRPDTTNTRTSWDNRRQHTELWSRPHRLRPSYVQEQDQCPSLVS